MTMTIINHQLISHTMMMKKMLTAMMAKPKEQQQRELKLIQMISTMKMTVKVCQVLNLVHWVLPGVGQVEVSSLLKRAMIEALQIWRLDQRSICLSYL